MSFLLGLVLFVIGSAVLAFCIAAIPGPHRPEGAGHGAAGHGHGGH